jgi:L-ascorbate metabolism protein UlaG (beta-lactamase superfamily)
MNININSHSSIQIDGIYFDPYNIKEKMPVAEMVFITHTHYDHLSVNDIKKIADKNTIFVATKDAKNTLEKEFPENEKIYVSPNETFDIKTIHIETFPAYNIHKAFHKKEFGWVGYKITKDGLTFAVVGDSDATPELEKLKCDVLFVPIGGTYTMDGKEAASLANIIKPKLVVPTHYNLIVGSKADEKTFLSNLDKSIDFKIFL